MHTKGTVTIRFCNIKVNKSTNNTAKSIYWFTCTVKSERKTKKEIENKVKRVPSHETNKFNISRDWIASIFTRNLLDTSDGNGSGKNNTFLAQSANWFLETIFCIQEVLYSDNKLTILKKTHAFSLNEISVVAVQNLVYLFKVNTVKLLMHKIVHRFTNISYTPST